MIFFDHADLSSAGKARDELQNQIEASLSGTADNPISDGMRLAQLQAGSTEEQTLALVMDRLQRLSHVTEEIDARLRRSERRAGWRGELVKPRGGGRFRIVGGDGKVYEIDADDPGEGLRPGEPLKQPPAELDSDQFIVEPHADPEVD